MQLVDLFPFFLPNDFVIVECSLLKVRVESLLDFWELVLEPDCEMVPVDVNLRRWPVLALIVAVVLVVVHGIGHGCVRGYT